MVNLLTKIAAASALCLVPLVAAQQPAAIYDGGLNNTDAPVKLGIGNGGAGQSGLIKGMPPTSSLWHRT